jgi:hypothetical protein
MDAAGINDDCRKSAATSNDFTNDPFRRRQRRSNRACRKNAAAIIERTNDFRRMGQRHFKDCRRSVSAALDDPANHGRRRNSTTRQRTLPQTRRSRRAIHL